MTAFTLICAISVPSLLFSPETPAALPEAVVTAMQAAGDNRAELERAWKECPPQQRAGLAFLLTHMPDSDRKSLKADYLLENLSLGYRARENTPWGRSIPEEIFLNDVLPYANLDETREAWRKSLMEMCLPMVKECKTAREAAQKLNSTLFGKVKVRYSTARKKANQSPKESMDQGLASCTGLSILLVDACRSVGVPARVVGTPLWANKRGNHTWVEIWDGRWYFAGAAEPDPAGLDRGWFVGDASQAIRDNPAHAIYAASFRRGKTHFPLVWDPQNQEVPAENVSDRYIALGQPRPQENVRVLVRLFKSGSRQRLSLPVRIEEPQPRCEVRRGLTRGDGADFNDILGFELVPERDYVVCVGQPVLLEKRIRTARAKEMLVEIEIPEVAEKLPVAQRDAVVRAARAYFEASAKQREDWKFDADTDALLKKNEDGVRSAVWQAYREAGLPPEAKKDFDSNQVRFKEYLSPYVVKKVGKKPAGGWPLFIAMHGGGGAPKQVNDSQWNIMQRYYKDHPGEGGYLYLALRAPNDTWNGFYDHYVPPLITNLIRQFLAFGEVDPDKVYIMGYSHGGYGAFYIGPKIPDRFAAVHVSAAAPSDGTISARTLRNTRFTFMIGEKDTMYGRADRCRNFNKTIEKLQEENKGEYPVKMEFISGWGHGGLPDRDKIKEMIAYRRQPVPGHLTWDLTDDVNRHFFWLTVPQPKGGASLDAKIADNTVTITRKDVPAFSLDLDQRLVKMDRPLKITLDGKTQEKSLQPSLKTLCETMAERGDPALAATCRISLK